MKRNAARILAGGGAILLLYLLLRAATPSPAAGTEPDTMCLASKIGLPCNPD
jgi:hypothetical protein